MEADKVQLGQGAGGELMQKLLNETLIPRIRNKMMKSDVLGISPDMMDDSATINDVAFTIDGHTIWPLEFPGGDIGSLSIYGTVNDLCVVGAIPEALALSMVIEEGLDIALLERISASIGRSCKESNTTIYTGDTKVVERGGVKGMVTSTAGIGWKHPSLDRCLDDVFRSEAHKGQRSNWLRDDLIRPGDHIILTGSVGDHGISILSFREGYGFETDLRSDVGSLKNILDGAIKAGGVMAAKDLTRGGLANGLNEWVSKSSHGIIVEEDAIKLKDQVVSACDMLGFDPFEIGNEGKAIISVIDGREEEVLDVVRSYEEGKDASIIGRVIDGKKRVILQTTVGGRRIMDAPYGDPVPRIC
jgi:hydrogenase expression/formation protein HypE